MDKEQVQMTSFQLVAHAGEAFSHFYEAVEHAREGRFDSAEKSIAAGEACMNEAHRTQTNMLSAEANGEDVAFSLMLVHGQDHLMTTIMFGRMAKELIEVYKELKSRG